MSYRETYLKHLPTPLEVAVEIGTNKGGWPMRLLDNVPGQYTVYCVDTWGGKWARAEAIFDQDLRKEIEQGRVVKLKMPSVEAAKQFDKPIDLLYIDGDHMDVLTDLVCWIPHVRTRGLVVGHDFTGHAQSYYVQRDVIRYFGGTVAWSAGPYTGYSAGSAGRVHSFMFRKVGPHGQQDRRASCQIKWSEKDRTDALLEACATVVKWSGLRGSSMLDSAIGDMHRRFRELTGKECEVFT